MAPIPTAGAAANWASPHSSSSPFEFFPPFIEYKIDEPCVGSCKLCDLLCPEAIAKAPKASALDKFAPALYAASVLVDAFWAENDDEIVAACCACSVENVVYRHRGDQRGGSSRGRRFGSCNNVHCRHD